MNVPHGTDPKITTNEDYSLWTWVDPEGYTYDVLFEEPEDAIEDRLDSTNPLDWPETLVIAQFTRMSVRAFMGGPGHQFEPLVSMIEALDEVMGCDPAEGFSEFEPSAQLIAAERKLLDLLADEYVPWACQEIDGKRETINVTDWVRKNHPGWAEEDDVMAWLTETANSRTAQRKAG